MTKLFIIRHGKTEQNKSFLIQGRINSSLSNTGREEALKGAIYLKENGYSFDAYYSSTLDRAYDTCAIIRDVLNKDKEIIKEEGFIEREFGSIEGTKIRASLYKKIVNDDVPGMEKSEIIEKRMLETALKVAKENEGKNVLIVSHSHAIKGLLKAIDKRRKFTDIIRNVSMTEIDVENGQAKIIYFNKKIAK